MIKGLIPALAEGGKIKIGGLGPERNKRDGGTYRIPQKLDHFIVTTTQRNQAGDLILDEPLMAALPRDADGQCREIPIVLHDDEIDNVFPTTYALYSGKKLACRGDGEQAVRWEFKDQKRTGNSKEMACPCPYLGATTGAICKPHGTLHCSIRVPGRAIAGAVHKWRTTSQISISRMVGSLQQILDVCGTLCGVPLVLKLEAIQVTPPNAPASTVYCCHIELRAADILEVQKMAIESNKMRSLVRQSSYRALLARPAENEDEIDEEETQLEFHPEGEAVVQTPALAIPAALLPGAPGDGAAAVNVEVAPALAAAPPPAAAAAPAAPKRGRHPADCACARCESKRTPAPAAAVVVQPEPAPQQAPPLAAPVATVEQEDLF